MKFLVLVLSFYFLFQNFLTCRNSEKNSATNNSNLFGFIQASLRAFDLYAMLTSTGNTFIIPVLKDLSDGTATLSNSCDAYATNPTATNLSQVRTDYANARKFLKRFEIISFGPSDIPQNFYVQLDSYVKKIDVNPTNIESTILNASQTSFTEANINQLGVQLKGFGALDYLLFSTSPTLFNQDVNLVHSNFLGNAKRISYLRSVCAQVRTQSRGLYNAWIPTSGNYISNFANPGRASSDFGSTKDAIDNLVTQLSFLVSSLIDLKIGAPTGLLASSVSIKDISKMESRFSDNSLSDAFENLNSLNSFYSATYNGVPGIGLSNYVSSLNPNLDQRMKTAILNCITSVSSVQTKYGTLRNAINQPGVVPELTTLFTNLRNLRILILTELVSTLGANTGVSGNDGD